MGSASQRIAVAPVLRPMSALTGDVISSYTCDGGGALIAASKTSLRSFT